MAKLYAQYRVLAAANRLIECAWRPDADRAAWSDERTRFKVNPIPAEDLQENSMPQPVDGSRPRRDRPAPRAAVE